MKRSIVFACLTLSLCTATLSFSGEAAAEETAASAEDVKRAAAAFDRGRSAYRDESYVEAAEQFEAADDYAPSATALRLAIASRKAAEQFDRAVTLATLGLALYPDDATLAEEANAVIQEHAATFGRVEVSCDEACELLLDNKLVHGKKGTSRTLFVTVGSHQVRATWSSDRNVTEKITVLAGETGSLTFAAPPIPVSGSTDPVTGSSDSGSGAVQPAEKSGGWSPVVFWTGAGLTVAGAGVSTFLGIRALNEPGKEKVREECADLGTDCPAYQQGLQNQTAANVAIGATAAIGVFTIITGVFLTDWSGDDDAKESAFLGYEKGHFSIRPTFSVGNGASWGATGTF